MAYLLQKDFRNEAIKIALAESLANGTFADTVYYLYSRRVGGNKVGGARAVYASSAVLKSVGEHFRAQLDGGFATDQKIPDETDSYGYESDSDLDDAEEEFTELEDGQIASSSQSKDKEVAEEVEVLPGELGPASATHCKYSVVVPDIAANTWQALVYFIYTGRINFAPLRSQGLEFRTQAIQKHRFEKPALPVLCSPKSMYRLADIVGLDDLKKLAEQEIKVRVSNQTIVEELFSRFSSTYPDILKFQLNFLCYSNVISQSSPAVREKLRAVAQGRLPHAENLLEEVLAKLMSLVSEPSGVGSLFGAARPGSVRNTVVLWTECDEDEDVTASGASSTADRPSSPGAIQKRPLKPIPKSLKGRRK